MQYFTSASEGSQFTLLGMYYLFAENNTASRMQNNVLLKYKCMKFGFRPRANLRFIALPKAINALETQK